MYAMHSFCFAGKFSTHGFLMELNTTQSEGGIKPISKSVVHQICSGQVKKNLQYIFEIFSILYKFCPIFQVIVSLSTAVKELVENALDAGATSIEIRLEDSGATSIQVIDNGSGVNQSDFSGLGKYYNFLTIFSRIFIISECKCLSISHVIVSKHCTSKIEQFEDVCGVETFGFRGEALSSLCALADLTVTTKTAENRSGFRLKFDSNGTLVEQSACARGQGTTVTLGQLFHSLPVRQREFLKNLKREFNKMVQVLYGYCLVADGVR